MSSCFLMQGCLSCVGGQKNLSSFHAICVLSSSFKHQNEMENETCLNKLFGILLFLRYCALTKRG